MHCVVQRTILGSFTKLRKAAVSFVMSACLPVCRSVRPSVRPSAGNDAAPIERIFMKFDVYFRKSVEIIQFSLKSDKKKGYFYIRPMYIYDNNRANYEIMWNNTAQPDRPQMTIHIIKRMRFVCWIAKATSTHSEYTIFILFRRQQRLHENASMLLLCVRCLSYLMWSLVTNKQPIGFKGLRMVLFYDLTLSVEGMIAAEWYDGIKYWGGHVAFQSSVMNSSSCRSWSCRDNMMLARTAEWTRLILSCNKMLTEYFHLYTLPDREQR
jgi:hypothetical protein